MKIERRTAPFSSNQLADPAKRGTVKERVLITKGYSVQDRQTTRSLTLAALYKTTTRVTCYVHE